VNEEQEPVAEKGSEVQAVKRDGHLEQPAQQRTWPHFERSHIIDHSAVSAFDGSGSGVKPPPEMRRSAP
jgi:hypothetical protein